LFLRELLRSASFPLQRINCAAWRVVVPWLMPGYFYLRIRWRPVGVANARLPQAQPWTTPASDPTPAPAHAIIPCSPPLLFSRGAAQRMRRRASFRALFDQARSAQ